MLKPDGTGRARHKFWIDGGYDRHLVDACEFADEGHRWWVFRLGDVIIDEAVSNPDEMMVICRGCFVPRCGYTTEKDPCMLPRHHEEPHVYASGKTEPVGA